MRLENVHHFTQRGRIAPGKNAFFDPGVHRFGFITSDGVNEPTSFWRQAAVNDITQFAIIFPADMFKHADGGKYIVFAGYVAVIVLDKFHLSVQSIGFRLFTRVENLLM